MYPAQDDLAMMLPKTCRVLANEKRLVLLREVCTNPGQTVEGYATATKLRHAVASEYLHMLQAEGLLVMEREGRYVRYHGCASDRIWFAPKLLAALRTALIRRQDTPKDVMWALTAFTHPRRIAIVAALAAGAMSLAQLEIETGIPQLALFRHLQKLERRELVTEQRNGDWRLKRPKDVVSKALVSFVLPPAE